MPPPGLLALLPGVRSSDLVDVVGRSLLARRVLVHRLRRIVIVRRRSHTCRLLLLSALGVQSCDLHCSCSCCSVRSDRGYQILLLLTARDLRNLLFLPRLTAVLVPTLIFFFYFSCLPRCVWGEASSRGICVTSCYPIWSTGCVRW